MTAEVWRRWRLRGRAEATLTLWSGGSSSSPRSLERKETRRILPTPREDSQEDQPFVIVNFPPVWRNLHEQPDNKAAASVSGDLDGRRAHLRSGRGGKAPAAKNINKTCWNVWNSNMSHVHEPWRSTACLDETSRHWSGPNVNPPGRSGGSRSS